MFKKPVLKFQPLYPELDSNFIRSATNSVPDWYKKIPKWNHKFPPKKAEELDPTVKLCVPFLEAFTSGYIICTPFDLIVSTVNQEPYISWRSGGTFIEVRDGNYVPTPVGFSSINFAWSLPVSFSVPVGYSILLTHPFNRFDLPFLTLSGVIDGGFVSPIGGKIPFFMKKEFEGIIPQGTPIAQLLPFKSINWSSINTPTLIEEGNKSLSRTRAVTNGWYKKAWWNKKQYN